MKTPISEPSYLSCAIEYGFVAYPLIDVSKTRQYEILKLVIYFSASNNVRDY